MRNDLDAFFPGELRQGGECLEEEDGQEAWGATVLVLAVMQPGRRGVGAAVCVCWLISQALMCPSYLQGCGAGRAGAVVPFLASSTP